MISSENKKYKKIEPKRIFDEMAELGLLEDLLEMRLKKNMENDSKFKADVINILFKKSEDVVPLVEMLYLESLSEDLSYFLEFTKLWRNQKH